MLLQIIVIAAIPAFLLAILGEHALARRRGRPGYRLEDTMASLGCGIAQQVSLVFVTGALVGGYDHLYRHARLVTFAPGSPWPWVLGFVIGDLAFYGWHRASHAVGVLWASHVVHHQSEEYNLAVALRQAIASSVTSAPFYYPAALLGVPTRATEVLIAASALYQFWLHTEHVGRLGPLERLLNTPSNHRVHHAVNARYLDRNFGGVLMLWDHLFGTWAEERGPIAFGVTKRLRSFNPLRAQLDGWAELLRRASSLRGLDRLRVLWRSPSWPQGGPGPTDEELARRQPLACGASPALLRYALVQFVPLTGGTLLLLVAQGALAPRALALGAALVFWTLLSLGGLVDGRRWAVPIELARLVALAAAAAAVAPAWAGALAAGAGALGVAAVLGIWLLRCAAPRAPATPARRLPALRPNGAPSL
jgi:sterol desaturase/sphingolipid hydroxylase (fatty acid hydroxylase superfamily)